jgi:hypothetical protein
MNFTIENDTLTIIQPLGSQKPNTTHELGYAISIMESIKNEIREYTDKFELDKIPEVLERLHAYRPMYEACRDRLHEIEIEERDAELLAQETAQESIEEPE